MSAESAGGPAATTEEVRQGRASTGSALTPSRTTGPYFDHLLDVAHTNAITTEAMVAAAAASKGPLTPPPAEVDTSERPASSTEVATTATEEICENVDVTAATAAAGGGGNLSLSFESESRRLLRPSSSGFVVDGIPPDGPPGSDAAVRAGEDAEDAAIGGAIGEGGGGIVPPSKNVFALREGSSSGSDSAKGTSRASVEQALMEYVSATTAAGAGSGVPDQAPNPKMGGTARGGEEHEVNDASHVELMLPVAGAQPPSLSPWIGQGGSDEGGDAVASLPGGVPPAVEHLPGGSEATASSNDGAAVNCNPVLSGSTAAVSVDEEGGHLTLPLTRLSDEPVQEEKKHESEPAANILAVTEICKSIGLPEPPAGIDERASTTAENTIVESGSPEVPALVQEKEKEVEARPGNSTISALGKCDSLALAHLLLRTRESSASLLLGGRKAGDDGSDEPETKVLLPLAPGISKGTPVADAGAIERETLWADDPDPSSRLIFPGDEYSEMQQEVVAVETLPLHAEAWLSDDPSASSAADADIGDESVTPPTSSLPLSRIVECKSSVSLDGKKRAGTKIVESAFSDIQSGQKQPMPTGNAADSKAGWPDAMDESKTTAAAAVAAAPSAVLTGEARSVTNTVGPPLVVESSSTSSFGSSTDPRFLGERSGR